jgi:hypothetical protein
MTILFFWMINQATEIGLLFGFRTSHTVANDLASLITSIGGVPGDATTVFEIRATSDQERSFQYEIDISDKIVCVTSYLNDVSESTSDCASHPYDLEDKFCKSNAGGLNLIIRKVIDENTKEPSITIDETGVGECELIG